MGLGLRWGLVAGLLLACGRVGFGIVSGDEDAGTIPGNDGAASNDGSTVSDSGLGPDGSDDAASTFANDECASPTDMTGGGEIVDDTCGATDSYDIVGCGGTPGAPDRFYSFRFPGTYTFSVSPGFDVQPMSANCMGQDLACAVNSIMNGGGFSYTVIVEKLDGGCGPFTLTIVHTP